MRKFISIFDFDGTLTADDMPKYSFMNRLGHKNGFQNKNTLNQIKKKQTATGERFIQSCLEHILQTAKDNKLQLTLPILCEGQDEIKWNAGIDSFFETLATHAKNYGLENKNYIITSGFEEYLQNLPIAKHFAAIYGSRLEIDKDRNIIGINQCMCDELKAKYLETILTDNGKQADDCTDVVYVGDGLTDKAPMQLVHEHGGKTIFIRHKTAQSTKGYYELNKKKPIVDYSCEADFTPNGDVVKCFVTIMNTSEYIRQFNAIDTHGVWADDTAPEIVIQKAKLAVADIVAGRNYTRVKRTYRLAGQSGSGKSTQLLPTILKVEEGKGNTPVVIAVRTFAKYHPRYDELTATLPAGTIREATNGFALKCTCAAYAMLLQQGYLTVLDLTIMDHWFESFMLSQVQSNNYDAEYHILAVNKDLSISFIEKRRKDINSPEHGKIVNASSIDYWYGALPRGIKFLSENDARNNCFIWTAYSMQPLYHGTLKKAPEALETGRALSGNPLHEDDMRRGKFEFLCETHKAF